MSEASRTIDQASFIRQSLEAERMHQEMLKKLREQGHEVIEHTSSDASVIVRTPEDLPK